MAIPGLEPGSKNSASNREKLRICLNAQRLFFSLIVVLDLDVLQPQSGFDFIVDFDNEDNEINNKIKVSTITLYNDNTLLHCCCCRSVNYYLTRLATKSFSFPFSRPYK